MRIAPPRRDFPKVNVDENQRVGGSVVVRDALALVGPSGGKAALERPAVGTSDLSEQ